VHLDVKATLHQRLTFTSSHLRNHSLVKDDATDQLHVEVTHTSCSDTRLRTVAKASGRMLSRCLSLATLSFFFVLCVADSLLDCFFKGRSACL
jgi:hypothetical protein